MCGAILQEGEEGICMKCNMDMPRTNYHLRKDNPVERMFWGKIPLEHALQTFVAERMECSATIWYRYTIPIQYRVPSVLFFLAF